MDLLEQTKYLCKSYNIKPTRSKGQNFLISEIIYDKIIETADLKKDDIVLEVGPGLGFLTERLARKVKKVIAVELDDKLAEILQARLKEQGIRNVEVVNKDILKISNFQFLISNQIPNPKSQITNYKIVANLPYNITSIFLRKFLSAEIKPSLMVLMLQKEVAQRITSKPGKMSLLAVSVQFYADAKITEYVLKENFWPKPKVDSALVKLKVKSGLPAGKAGKLKVINEKEFFRLVKIGFSAKRKMLKNNLANGYKISHEKAEKRLKLANFSPKIRAQELSVKDWQKLLGKF